MLFIIFGRERRMRARSARPLLLYSPNFPCNSFYHLSIFSAIVVAPRLDCAGAHIFTLHKVFEFEMFPNICSSNIFGVRCKRMRECAVDAMQFPPGGEQLHCNGVAMVRRLFSPWLTLIQYKCSAWKFCVVHFLHLPSVESEQMTNNGKNDDNDNEEKCWRTFYLAFGSQMEIANDGKHSRAQPIRFVASEHCDSVGVVGCALSIEQSCTEQIMLIN